MLTKPHSVDKRQIAKRSKIDSLQRKDSCTQSKLFDVKE